MAHFPTIQLTNNGRQMIGESQGGAKLIFLRAELGDGQLVPDDSIDTLTALKHKIMELPLQGYLNKGNGEVRLRFVANNHTLEHGFMNREVGIIAKTEGGREQLYAYTNAGNLADYIPDKNVPIDGEIIDVHIVVGNAKNLTAVISDGAYITKKDFEAHRTAAELDHPDGSVKRRHIADGTLDEDYVRQSKTVADGSVDWNTLTEEFCYKIQGATMTEQYHAPVGEYNFGMLIVHRLKHGVDGEHRTLQNYYPHTDAGSVYSRMLNGAGWTLWRKYEPVDRLNSAMQLQDGTTNFLKPVMFDGRANGNSVFPAHYYHNLYEGDRVYIHAYTHLNNGSPPARNTKFIFRTANADQTYTEHQLSSAGFHTPGIVTAKELRGKIIFPNNTWNRVGDDVDIGDCDETGMLGVKSSTDNPTGICFANFRDPNNRARLRYDGTKMICDRPFDISGTLHGRADHAGGADNAATLEGHNLSAVVDKARTQIAILTGTISDGGTLPLPNGYEEAQCKWMVSVAEDNPQDASWDIKEQDNHVHYRFWCKTEGRKVVCKTIHGRGWDNRDTISGTANYIVIGVK